MTLKDKAVQHASHYFDEGDFKKDLSELIAVKTESQNQKYNLKNYYKNNIIPMLTEMGFKCNIMKNSSPEANVFLFAERIENHNFKTIQLRLSCVPLTREVLIINFVNSSELLTL